MKRILIIISLFFYAFSMSAQEEVKSSNMLANLEFGGMFGFSWGSSKTTGSSTSLQISPQVGYRFHPKASAGGGVGYIYDKYDGHSANYMGLNAYFRFRPIQYISLQFQPEFYRTWGNYYDSRFVPVLLLGGGVIIPVTSNAGMSISFYYDVLGDDYSPYRGSLLYSIGYTLSF
ncbi:hypothetical protein LJB84_00955 [Bacteroidales bacterium OttesenSCG-928-J19]|nr:hypothetical protein [Bacteroidales bacterium OttesenSCG-928-J19]